VTRLHRSSVGEPVGLGPSSKENAKEATNNSDNNTPPVEGAPAPHVPIDPFDEDDVVLWTSDDATKRVVYRTAGEIDVYALENLAQAVGWPKRPVDKVEQALKHSFLVAALHLETIDESGAPIEEESELIGLARATSDHVFNATIWDVLVDPKWQGNGFGTALVERTVNTLHRRDIANISLFADAKAITFYERLGFKGDLEGVKGLFFYPTYR